MSKTAALTARTSTATFQAAIFAGGEKTTLSSFFAYHGVLAPGVRLFRRISFRAKAFWIAAAFLLPIVVLAHHYFSAQNGQIAFSAKERLGVQYAKALVPLLLAMQDERLAATLAAAGSAQGGDPANGRQQVAERLKRLENVHQAVGADLSAGAAYQTLVQSLKSPVAPGDGAAVFAAHTQRLNQALHLLGVSTDNSNLTLDPDIDTYYLMDGAMFRLPQMLELAAQMRGLGALILHSGRSSPEQERLFHEMLALLKVQAEGLQAGIDKAVAYNADVGRSVSSAQSLKAVADFVQHVENTVLRKGGLQGDVPAHLASANGALEALFRLTETAGAQLDDLIAARVDRMAAQRNAAGAVIVLGLSLAIYAFVCFQRVLSGGMDEVGRHIEAIRVGDLTTRPRPWGQDEAAQLMRRLGDMQDELSGLVDQVRSGTDYIARATEQISGSSRDLAERTGRSAVTVKETANDMQEIASTAKASSLSLTQATQLAASNATVAERGGRIVAEVVQTMEAINHSSSRISEIIGTIDGIAFQTNILALNAAVEAARAGEQGRGFAVVASEVRALAQRSSAAAREIKTLITTSVEQAENGARVVHAAGQTMEDIVGQAQQVRSLVNQAANGSQAQADGVGRSAMAVQDLDRVTQQNAALVVEAASSAESMRLHAHQLAERVARFRV